MQGIYAITCVPTGEQYIGMAKHVYRRWWEHENLILNGRHHSRSLMQAWITHAPTAFTWSVLAIVDDASALRQVEREYLRKLRPAFNTEGARPRRHRAELLAADRAAKEAGGIWITEAMVTYGHSRNWVKKRIADGIFQT